MHSVSMKSLGDTTLPKLNQRMSIQQSIIGNWAELPMLQRGVAMAKSRVGAQKSHEG